MTEAPLLSIRDLSVAFHQGGRQTLAVDRVSFDLAKGRTLAVVGESGSGKSVTALSVVKLLAYPAASHPSGEIWFNGRDLLKASEDELRRVRGNDITMVFQEPMTSLNPLHTIERQIGEILELHGRASGAGIRPRVIELLKEVGIPRAEERLTAYPHQLSGGQRQRVMIAMALANEPELLIADEPTTALDVTVQAQILALLKRLQDKRGMAILFITHDLGIVRKLAHDVVVMMKGKVVEAGPVTQVFDRPQHAYTQKLLASEPKGRPARPDPSRKVIVETDKLKIWFPIKRGFLRKTVGYVKAVDEISVTVREGETVGVVGESGSGKTTLGQAILRLIRSEGPIIFMGSRIDGKLFKEMRPLRKDLQIVFQDPFGSLSPASRSPRSSRRGCSCRMPACPTRSGARSSRRRCRMSGSIRRRWTAIRTNSRAASASASPSPAPWRSIRSSSCWTSRPPRSTRRYRCRSSSCCAVSRRSAASPTSSSATISRSSGRWRIP